MSDQATMENARYVCSQHRFVAGMALGVLLLIISVTWALPRVSAEGLLTLDAGRSTVIRVSDAVRVAVADPRVADVAVISRDEVLITGLEAGETTLHIWDDKGLVTSTVVVSESGLSSRIAAAIDREELVVRAVGNRLFLEGHLRDQNELDRALEIASSYGKEVISLVQLTQPLQVALQVQVVEADLSAASELGVSWGSLTAEGLDPNTWYVGEKSVMNWCIDRLSFIGAKIQSMLDKGDASILAAPTLVVMSGETARFLAGGEIPVLFPQGDSQAIQWKEYGVLLQMCPVVDSSGYVTVTLAPEVSTLDWANGIRLSTIVVPALRTRRAETTVRVADGSTLVLGGLISQEESRQAREVPILASLPVIGRLFRSDKFSRGETELLIFVTPHVLTEETPLTAEVILTPQSQ
jgi:pilus assembly protein CpaC